MLLFRRRTGFRPNRPYKYFLAALVFGALIGGTAVLVRLIDPYTLFGSAAGGAWFGLSISALLAVLVWFRRRLFCSNICPVGTVLGIISKHAVNKIYIEKSQCVSCGLCASRCPTGSIDIKNKTVDNETCIKCFNCLSRCPRNSLHYGTAPIPAAPFSPTRRKWLTGGAVAAIFVLALKSGIDLGKAVDDDAIEFGILSDQVNAIKAVVSTRHLLVFTTGAEWMVSGEPLTPEKIQLKRQTNVGIYAEKILAPQQIDGATVFVSRSGRQLREFLYTDVEQAYQAKDLTILSNDIISRPRDISFDPDSSVVYLVLEDGTLSCLTTYRTEAVTAWCKLNTAGKFISAAVIGDNIYFCVERKNGWFIEKFVDDYYSDCSLRLTTETPQRDWSGLEHLEGEEVVVLANGFSLGKFKVEEGEIHLLDEADEIIVGLPYEHLIEPLPYMVEAERPYSPKALRVIGARFRILDSKSFCIDIGSGYFHYPLKRIHRDKIFDSPPLTYSGDVQMRALGWIREMNKPMWSIKSDEPLAFTLLSAVAEIKLKE